MCRMSRAGLKLGSMGDTALVTGVPVPWPLNSSGRDNGGGGVLSGSCLGEVREGEEEAELRELSEEILSSEEMGEKADLALDCWSN